MNCIEIENLSVEKSKRKILNSLNLVIPNSKSIGLLGPSGSGKTTLMRSIMGLQKITEGKIRILGFEAGAKDLRNKISYSTQSASLYLDLTCIENLEFFSSLFDENELSIQEILDLVQLNQVKNQLAKTLSGGEKTRLALGTALVGAPELIILDEPTVGLDPILRKQLWQIFKELNKKGKTLLISSHVMDEAENCDHIFMIRDGKIIASGNTSELKSRTGLGNMEDVFISLVKS
jgi:ABC-2 type transport system ATP-binding protein